METTCGQLPTLYRNHGQSGMNVLKCVECDIVTEEQTEYKTTLQCFGQFERDHVTCKVCSVSVECYDRTFSPMDNEAR